MKRWPPKSVCRSAGGKRVMVDIETVLRIELGRINQGIVKARRALSSLLDDPVIRDGERCIRMNTEALENIRRKCTLPSTRIFLPITFYLPAGSYECYLLSRGDATVVRDLGLNPDERGGRFWVAKWKVRELTKRYPGCFQVIITQE